MMNALEAFETLPLAERLFVRARLFSAPLKHVAAQVPRGARIADVGCGHGALSALLALDGSRTVVGVDPDPRKISAAKASVGRFANASFEVGTVESLAAAQPGRFDAVVVADVLYLLPVEAWRGFLSRARDLLHPGGALFVHAAEADGSWRHYKAQAQEWVMVKVLGKTRTSGALMFRPRHVLEGEVIGAGFTISTVTGLGAGYSTPHVLIHAKRV